MGLQCKPECNFPFFRVTETLRKGTVVPVPVGLNFVFILFVAVFQQCVQAVFSIGPNHKYVISIAEVAKWFMTISG